MGGVEIGEKRKKGLFSGWFCGGVGMVVKEAAILALERELAASNETVEAMRCRIEVMEAELIRARNGADAGAGLEKELAIVEQDVEVSLGGGVG